MMLNNMTSVQSCLLFFQTRHNFNENYISLRNYSEESSIFYNKSVF